MPADVAAYVGTWAAQQAYQLGRQGADMEVAAGLLGENNEYRASMAADQELAAYGPGGREHFGDPRPGDFPGRAAAEPEQEAEYQAEAG